ncbi:nucleotide sugar dehydrogenase [Phycisphaera mikurensis]|uniref:Putative nucleotide sugar dehydrogenase n=1 Tax=Phycisphaera mikurensis (strain NBRC 102666 / KCTC 22515 / FYK2301M01) TaxID=1142394 RepID=I0IAB6_PHYMF|nr:nucleotide sugar dehydrogenase [Phycisphaera mikurensis]MBB6441797.1 UDP-N-acetyl-D-glucosamine dehydrogenase [Phycisphaera mikurensis]BAM02204.1 putative nucleotide sugar dehydrogenase [Phycisphaera mikurensis NBRC 102666]
MTDPEPASRTPPAPAEPPAPPDATAAGAELARRFADRTAAVAVVGLGYVGLPLCRAMLDAGFRVLGFDADPAKVAAASARPARDWVPHLGEGFVERLVGSGRFEATGDAARLADADAVLLCVPTPLKPDLSPDLSFVRDTAAAVAAAARPGQLVVLESTTYPGTTREVVLPPLEAAGLVLGRSVFVAYAPEREDPGRRDHTTATIPRLVGGLDAASGRLAATLYRAAISRVVEVSSAEVAEAAKLHENVFRAVNIGLVNEQKELWLELGIDPFEVLDAAATKPFGFMRFDPGPGIGGHCIPIDPHYLAWRAREAGLDPRFIELAGEVNRRTPARVAERTAAALAGGGRPVRGARVLVLGLAYKADVADTRESPALDLIDRLQEAGAAVSCHDPHVPRSPRHAGLASVPLTAATLAAADAVVVATDHAALDLALVGEHASLVVDTRNAMAAVRPCRARVVLA